MIILGIDPGINFTGWGVIHCQNNKIDCLGCGVINTKQTDPLALRIAKISIDINKIVEDFSPDVAAMEEIFVNKNPLSSIKLSHARGAIMAAIGIKDIPLYEFAPNKIKKAVTGFGKAEKSQIKSMIERLILNTNILKIDSADALAIAYTCFVSR